MARINNTAAYAISSPVTADDIVIGSEGGNGGDTKNFQMSDILTYIMSSSTLTLQDVCDNGSATTTGITVAGTTTLNGTVDINNTADISGNTTIGGTTTLNGVLDANSTADISGNTTIGGTLGVNGASTLDSVAVTNNATVGGTLGVSQAATFALGVTIDNAGLAVNGSGGIIVGSTSGISSFGPISGTALNSTGGLLVSGTSFLGEIDASGVADIADTLTLSRATGTGLQVDADANIDGNLTITLGSALYTDEIRTTSPSSNLAFYSGGLQRGAFTSLGVFSLTGGLNVLNGGALMNQGLTVNNLAQFNDDVLLDGSVPSSSTDTGIAGQIAVDATHIYVCVGTNSWGRVAIDTTPF